MTAEAQALLAALEAALQEQARLGRTIGYLALAGRLEMAGPFRIHRITQALEVLVRRDHAAGRPLLATLAVGRSGIPGRGFFQLLQALGRYQGADDGVDARRWHAEALAQAIAYWTEPSPEGKSRL
jgi:hypothetical protein